MNDGAPPWLLVARLEEALRVEELPGGEHNIRILTYHDHTSLDAVTDEVPWCASFVNYCVDTCSMGLKGTNSARARSWLRWGISLRYPALGCVVVMKRGGIGQPGKDVVEAQGHVGFFAGFDRRGYVRVLGGNQSDRVNTRSYLVERVLDYRWPE